MSIVIDANISIAWLVDGKPNPIASAALEAMGDDGAVVPALWRWEVQDVLRRYDERGSLSRSIQFVLTELRELPIVVDGGRDGLFGNEFEIAQHYGLTVSDAAYLELAIRERSSLATIDKQLAAAAKKAGVPFQH